MWLVILFKDQKFSIEVTGEETIQDVKNILTEVYGFSPKIAFSYNNTPILDKYNFNKINEVQLIKGFEVVELRIINQDKLLKDLPSVRPGIRQNTAVVMGLRTDVLSANSESSPSSRRSNISSSGRLRSQIKLSQPGSKDTSSSGQRNQTKETQNAQTKPTTLSTQSKLATAQKSPAKPTTTQKSPVKPTSSSNTQTKPAPATSNTQTKPAPAPAQSSSSFKFSFSKKPQNTQKKPATTQNSIPSKNAQALIDMGYTQQQAEDALKNSNNDLNAAANYLLSIPASSNSTSNTTSTNSNVTMLMEMGYTQKQAEDALRSTHNDLNAAANLLLS